jgi:hypothetical protein
MPPKTTAKNDPASRRVQAFIQEAEDYINTVTAESRALRTILQTFLRRFLESTPRPHQAFGALKADTLGILAGEAARDASLPAAQRAAEAALFQAESILAELEAWLPPTDEAKPPPPRN